MIIAVAFFAGAATCLAAVIGFFKFGVYLDTQQLDDEESLNER